jgi:hypothetical protein
MNALAESNGTQLVSASELIRNPGMMAQFNALAELLSSSTITVPKHLQNHPGDCFAIVMQAAQWGMNPFSVAQKTHLVNGVLGYEAQLVNAVIQSSGAIHGRFHYQYTGEDTNNLACRVGAVIKGESEIVWSEWLEKSKVATQNSPLWKTNPKQQLGYLQVKNWARLYCPGAILGVYSEDELQEFPAEKVINPLPAEKVVVYCSDENFEKNAESWRTKVEKDNDPEKLIKFLKSKYELTDEQKNTIYSWGKAPVIEGELA